MRVLQSEDGGLVVLQVGAEVGVEHRRVLRDGGGRAVGDLLARGHHHHAFAEVHDEAHVVLDQQDGHAFVGQRAHEARELGGLGVVEAGRGLVEDQQRRLQREGAGDLEVLALAVGQVGRELAGKGFKAGAFQRLHREVADAARDGAPPEQAVPRAVAHVAQRADRHVVEHRHVRQDAQVLEGAGDA